MEKEEYLLTDWQRILIGTTPWEFMLEVFVRTVIIYLFLLIAMRLLGKRMTANISIFEMGVMIALGAIVSVPMQSHDRGIIPGVIILICIVVFQRSLSWINFKSRKIESVTQGKASLLIKDGVIDIDELSRSTLTHEQLFAQIRGKKLKHLGQVKRVYLEACGIFSIIEQDEPKPGLLILPSSDEKLFNDEERSDQYMSCKNCGFVEDAHNIERNCSNCNNKTWDKAVKQVEKEFELTFHLN